MSVFEHFQGRLFVNLEGGNFEWTVEAPKILEFKLSNGVNRSIRAISAQSTTRKLILGLRHLSVPPEIPQISKFRNSRPIGVRY